MKPTSSLGMSILSRPGSDCGSDLADFTPGARTNPARYLRGIIPRSSGDLCAPSRGFPLVQGLATRAVVAPQSGRDQIAGISCERGEGFMLRAVRADGSVRADQRSVTAGPRSPVRPSTSGDLRGRPV